MAASREMLGRRTRRTVYTSCPARCSSRPRTTSPRPASADTSSGSAPSSTAATTRAEQGGGREICMPSLPDPTPRHHAHRARGQAPQQSEHRRRAVPAALVAAPVTARLWTRAGSARGGAARTTGRQSRAAGGPAARPPCPHSRSQSRAFQPRPPPLLPLRHRASGVVCTALAVRVRMPPRAPGSDDSRRQ